MTPSNTGWTERPGVTLPGGVKAMCTRCHGLSAGTMTDATLPTGWLGMTELPTPAAWRGGTCRARYCDYTHYHPIRKAWLFCTMRCARLWLQDAERDTKEQPA